ncbi:hypothetical protein CR513_59929, partial [Mucuna pruriens]
MSNLISIRMNIVLLLTFGCVFNSKTELSFINYEENVNKVNEGLYNSFGEYINQVTTSSSFLASSSRDTYPISFICTSNANLKSSFAYHREIRQNTSNDSKSQLNIDVNMKRKVIDILKGLKKHGTKVIKVPRENKMDLKNKSKKS